MNKRLMALLAGLVVWLNVSLAHATIIAYSDRAVWESAVGTPNISEDFNGFTTDTEFRTQIVPLNGMTVQSLISNPNPIATIPNYIDALPLEIPPIAFNIDGTPYLFGQVQNYPATSGYVDIRFDFLFPTFAWGATFNLAQILAIDVFDSSNTLLGTLSAASGGLEFVGFGLTAGEQADHIIIRSSLEGLDGFGMDNVALVASIPETPILALLGIGLAGLGGARHRGNRVGGA